MKAIPVRSPSLMRQLRLLLRGDSPMLRAAAVCGCALLLSALGLGGRPLPLASALILALPLLPEGLAAALGGVAGDLLFWPWPAALEPLAVSLLLLIASVLFRAPQPRRWFKPALCAAAAGLIGFVFLFDAGISLRSLALFFCKPLLAAAAYCSVPSRPVDRRAALPRQTDTETPLRRLSEVFALLHRSLSEETPPSRATLSEVYDAAADKVCLHCARAQLCWQEDARRTYDGLCAAGEPILRRGNALREDFPEDFAAACPHMEGFLTAVNQALDAERSRRRLHNRMQEGSRVLAGQYLFVSRCLARLAEDARQPAPPPARYVPDFAVRTACKPGNRVSGDHGACFRDRRNRCCLLLCDGMGCGEDAARESDRAVRALTGLLEANVAPDTAMELLNDFYVMRQTSAFATVDLLRLELESGTGVLYKWGAPPSYLLREGRLETLGTASPPPGLCAEETAVPQQLRLSLRDGETLIMVSDGAFCPETAQRAAAFRGGDCRALAEHLIAGLREQSTDDLTVAVLRLASSQGFVAGG